MDEDLEMINEGHDLSTLEYFAILYRAERKKTLWAQLELVQFIQIILEDSYKIAAMVEEGESIREIDRYYKSTYMRKMPSEVNQCDE